MWLSQSIDKTSALRVKQCLIDQFMQTGLSDIDQSPKCLCYRIFKSTISQECYLSKLDTRDIVTLSRFRCGSHRLPIETGRWQNIPREERFCRLCNSRELGDEYHYIMSCKALDNERQRFLPCFYTHCPNTYKYSLLFNTQNIVVLQKLCKFIHVINVKISAPPGNV